MISYLKPARSEIIKNCEINPLWRNADISHQDALRIDLDGTAGVIGVTGITSKDLISSTRKALPTILKITGPTALILTIALACYIF